MIYITEEEHYLEQLRNEGTHYQEYLGGQVYYGIVNNLYTLSYENQCIAIEPDLLVKATSIVNAAVSSIKSVYDTTAHSMNQHGNNMIFTFEEYIFFVDTKNGATSKLSFEIILIYDRVFRLSNIVTLTS